MARTIDGERRPDGGIIAFYDSLASDYDAMTGFEKRLVQERPYFQRLVDRYALASAVDAGTGTGIHAVLLAQLGVRVTAVDVSPEMLRRLSGHAREMQLEIDIVESGFQTLSSAIGKDFDAVFCMGNSLVHLLSAESVELSLLNFARVLRPRGMLFLQVLNYERILNARERIQNVREFNGRTYVRFYDFEPDVLCFNILKLERKAGGVAHSLSSVKLRPILKEEFLRVLGALGFSDIRLFGSITQEEFDPVNSKDMVILARRAP